MSTILKLEQGSPEWHAHRSKYRNASETPVVLGVSPWQTPYQLWLEKTGRANRPVTFPMQRGKELEAAARAAYEALTGHVMQPLVLVDGEYSASLDGMTLAGDLVLEIKCPMKGRDSELWLQVAGGALPEHYAWQVQHQLMVSGASRAEVYVFDGTEGRLLEVRPAQLGWERIWTEWTAFMKFLSTDTPPPLSERDTLLREDAEWQQRAASYIAAKKQADEAASALESARRALIDLTQHSSESGAGVTVTRYWRAGNVDYKTVPELRGVNLERYRGAPRQETRITLTTD
jgi:putative phage-type endonuclease